MIETSTSYPHLTFRKADGLPVIDRVNFKAIHLIANQVAHGWSAEELVVNFPQLTLGEVYSALAWFADHQEEVMVHLEAGAANARAQALAARHHQIAARLPMNGRRRGDSSLG